MTDAEEAYLKAIEMDNEQEEQEGIRGEGNGGNGDVYVNLGNLYMYLKKYPDARACYEKALQVGGKDGEVEFNLGVALEKEGNVEEAVCVYERAKKSLDGQVEQEQMEMMERVIRNAQIKLAAKSTKKE